MHCLSPEQDILFPEI
ncbi:uncharacterized protein FTOL_12860 [Fusarium torulosum]|uniref:Uncharacterized protein n=1 Tax=Fusarium torulosum TaxID=33205 RepID=A0AAE8MMP1_9HYPO|nr:uncharacterized protein FTOL_12860 [Fusarium torulosum]